MLWGYAGEEGARNSLRQTLHELRHLKPQIPGLVITAEAVSLEPAQVQVDVAEFELAAKEQTLSSLERAVRLYAGEFLHGFSLRDDSYERWRAGEAARLQDIALSVFERLLDEYMKLNRRADATRTANRVLAIDPLHEMAHQTLINVYFAEGRHSLARQHYQECQEMFERELGATPKIHLPHGGSGQKTGLGSSSVTSVNELAGPSLSSFQGAPVIAVLPMECLASQTRLFARTLNAQLIATLSKALPVPIVDLQPVARLDGGEVPGLGAAKEIGARYAVGGSVAKWQGRWRASFWVIDTATSRHLCNGTCQGADRDLFDLVDRFAWEMTTKISYQVQAFERRRALASRSHSPDFWECFQRGMAYCGMYSIHTITLARNAFEHAIGLESNNARAVAALAKCVMYEAIYLTSRDRHEAFTESLEIVHKAQSLDKDDWFVNWVLGTVYQRKERFDLAWEFMQRAHRASPVNPEIAIDIGNLLSFMGKPNRGIPIMASALALNDRSACLIARSHLQAGNYRAAQLWAKRTIAVMPDNTWTYIILASALGHLGRTEEAWMALQECERRQPGRVNFEFTVRPTQYRNPHDHDHILAGVQKAGWQP